MYSTAMNGFSLFTFGTSRDGAYSRQGAQGYSKGALIGRRVLIELLRYVYLNHHHHNNNITTNKCTATTTPITPTPADCDVICAFSAKRLSDKCRVLHLCKKKSFPVGSQMERAFPIENYLKKWNTLMQKYSSFLGFTEFVGKITVPFAFLFR